VVNLRDDEKGLRMAAQGVLAFIGLVLLGAGLALLSGVTQDGRPAAALVMVQPLPDAPTPAARGPQGLGEAPAGGPPRAGEPPRHEGRPPRAGQARARLAIVIDDLGFTLEPVERLLAMGYPITYSILPNGSHSRETGELVHRSGGRYIIHMPMQPFDYPRENPGPNSLLLSQGMEETARRVREYMQLLPDAIGASNHMGSAYTFDEDRMQVVQTVLAEHHLFFLNSKTSATRVPEEIAHQWGYPYLQRDVFLDNEVNERSIEAAFQQAVRVALRDGHAIAIGHPHPQTLHVLARDLPRLAGEGVEPVTLSALLGH
jgi:uncharacterized protein